MIELEPYDIFYRRNLPHWQRYDSWHFVTFRTANSLPKKIFEKLRDEEQKAINTLKRLFPSNINKQKYLLHSWKFDWIDNYLDKLNSKCYLHNIDAAKVVKNERHFSVNRVVHQNSVIQVPDCHVVALMLQNIKRVKKTDNQINPFLINK